MNQLVGPQHEVKLAASSSGSAYADTERAEPVGFGRRPRKAFMNLERMLKVSPAYGAWNVKKVVVGTGEALLGPCPVGTWSAFVYNW
ncbi:MAG TPA: hypothetical protein VMU77_03190 [Acidimicrobiales bacterium]|nr:hypothetical protein [Acidimicrobiales bacterium]